ncbi:MAG TPA: alpha-amylase family glycosyl hydrolase [Hanamia sp.]
MSNKNKPNVHPKWSYNSNIYEVNVRQYTLEGTFAAFAKSLPRLRDMGVDILWFMPITPISQRDRLGTLGSYYAIEDFKGINPEFGTLDDFKALVNEAHDLGFKIIVDFVADHTGNDHPWLKDHPDFYVLDNNREVLHPHGWSDVSQLNYDTPELWEYMIDVLKYWVKECDLDGFRCDMAHLVRLDFWIEAKKKLSKVKDNLFWLGECEDPEYHQVFDATYTWRWMHASQEFYQNKMNLQSLLTVLYKSVTEFPRTAMRAYFTSNHDENSWNGTEYEKYGDAALLLAVFSCTWDGIPMIYSGQELPNRKRLKFFDKDQIEWDNNCQLHEFYKMLLTLKSENKSLRSGDPNVMTQIVSHPDDHKVFAYLRKNKNVGVLTILNFCDQGLNFEVINVNGVYRNVFGGDDINFKATPQVYLNAWGYLVFERIDI